jgi:hypothetical protein
MRLTLGLLTQSLDAGRGRAAKVEKGDWGIRFGILDVLFLIEEEILTSRSCGTQTRPEMRVLKRFNRLTETVSPTERCSLR